MICEHCQEAADTYNMDLHGKCKGKTHCTCGHRKPKSVKVKIIGRARANGQGQTERNNQEDQSA